VYYCAQSLDTAMAEVRYHQQRFLLQTRQGPLRTELRLYLAELDARLVDVRNIAECHISDDYGPSQRMGVTLRREHRDGILYRSVRHEGGLCAAVFRPPVLRHCRQSKHYAFHFDGTRVTAIDELQTVWSAAQ
jgi:hypothetical protein